MFTLEQKMFIVQCYFRNGERLENGEWSYSTPRVFEEFQQKFPDFQGTYSGFYKRPCCQVSQFVKMYYSQCTRLKVVTQFLIESVLLGTRKTGQMCHSVVKISEPYLSYS
jgi:hypothetical protein